MEKQDIKSKLINTCVSSLESGMEQTRKLSEEIQEQISEYGQNKDRYDSFRTKMERTKEMYMQQMEKAASNIKTLMEIPIEQNHIVGHGSIVITDKQRFFVSVGVGKMLSDSQDYFLISVSAPIYNVMRDRKVGDTFIFNNQKHTILEIV